MMAQEPTKLDKLFEGEPEWDTPEQVDPRDRLRAMKAKEPAQEAFLENCPKCHGTGQFITYSGRRGGNCFTCKGRGKLSFKTSPEQRAKDRQAAAAKKARTATSWAEANAAEWEWINTKATTFGFAASMLEAVRKYGSLTERQHATVQRLMEGDRVRDANRAAERAAREGRAEAVDISAISRAFHQAQLQGVRNPKLRLDTFVFKLSSKGPVYITEREVYLGKITEGRFHPSRECTPELQARVLAAASDPKSAAIAYGQRFGQCSVCGRELTNKVSIDLGIGPICASRYGWGE